MKKCIKCNLEKDEVQFAKNRNVCLICRNEQLKRYRKDNSEAVKEQQKRYRLNNPEKQMLKHARERSKQKNLPFNIEEIDIIIPTICPVLGIPLKSGSGKGRMQPNSPSLDRIIPEKGYVRGNIVVMSSKANTMKSNATLEEIIKLGEFAKKLLEETSKND